MDRRSFLRRAALVAAGAIAADQLELAERLGWTRRLFPSADVGPTTFSIADPYGVAPVTGTFVYVQTNVRYSLAFLEEAARTLQDAHGRGRVKASAVRSIDNIARSFPFGGLIRRARGTFA